MNLSLSLPFSPHDALACLPIALTDVQLRSILPARPPQGVLDYLQQHYLPKDLDSKRRPMVLTNTFDRSTSYTTYQNPYPVPSGVFYKNQMSRRARRKVANESVPRHRKVTTAYIGRKSVHNPLYLLLLFYILHINLVYCIVNGYG